MIIVDRVAVLHHSESARCRARSDQQAFFKSDDGGHRYRGSCVYGMYTRGPHHIKLRDSSLIWFKFDRTIDEVPLNL